jgi:methyl-accepting chemotaxis protein
MPKWMLAPAFAILKRLNFSAGFALAGVLFLLPLGIALAYLGLWGGTAATPPAPVAVLIGLLLLLAVYMLTAVYLYMVFGVERLVRVTQRVAAGELIVSKESFGEESTNTDSSNLWRSILTMNDRLGEIVRQVRTSAQSIVLSARDIAEGNEHLAQRTQEQAAALEQTASGMEQLASTAQQNANDCARANQLAAGAREVAGKAAGQMQQLAETMQRIDGSARRVGDILSTVEGIAFQTNILALNAAVEAARAGDQGRGFAVVATEVRSLAQRSAVAAKEIKALIAESVDSAEQGSRMVDTAEATMNEVVTSVRAVGEVIGGIATASREQSAGIESINQAVVQIDSGNQQNATLVEEASAAAQSFEQEAARLLDVVSRFKTDRSADRGRVIGIVKAAAEHVRKVGPERACADFNDRDGRFGRGEQYVFAIGLDGRRLAYAPDTRLVGTDIFQLRDADGRAYGRDIVEQGRENGFGWCELKILNPKTNQVEPKSVYVERVGDMVIGAGIYRSDEDASQGAATRLVTPGARGTMPRIPLERPVHP